MRNLWLVPALLATSLISACGTAALGESCSDIGETSGCDDGLICDVDGGEKVCLTICTTDADCASTESCTAVTGVTTKACHTK